MATLRKRYAAWHRDTFFAQESTRPIALVRILLAMVLWFFWAPRFLLFEHLPPLLAVLGVAFVVSGLLTIVGLYTRLSSLVFGAVSLFFVYYIGVFHAVHYDEVWAFDSHNVKFLALALFIIALAPSGRSLSVDRYLAVKRARAAGHLSPAATLPTETAPKWPRKLLLWHVSVLFFFGAVSKTNADFLLGYRLEQILLGIYFGSDYPDIPFLREICSVLGVTAWMGESLIAVGILWEPLKKASCVALLLFAVSIFLFLPQHNFAVVISILTLLYYPETTARWLDGVFGSPAK